MKALIPGTTLVLLLLEGLAQASPPHRPLPPRYAPRPHPVHPIQPGRPSLGAPPASGASGRRIQIVGPITGHPHEARALQILQGVFQNQNCDRLNESLRRISNAILSSASVANADPRALPPGDRRAELRRRAQADWRETLQSRIFHETVFDGIAEAFRSCDASCIEDGEAVGALSATLYCAASIGLEGLDAPGFRRQSSLPVCSGAIRTGCLQSFRSTARTYDGCSPYLSGVFERTFLETLSQDCFMR